MDKVLRTLFALALMSLAGNAAATYINGTINIGGGSAVYNNGTNSTGIDFNCGNACGGSVNMWPSPTGDFSGLGGISTNDFLTLYSFYYTQIPQKTIWEIDNGTYKYSFTLASVSVVSGDVKQDPNCASSQDFGCLVLSGTGYFNITNSNGSYAGFDQTFGSWVYSQSGASFSSQSTAVPEPGTIALLGLGLVGIGAVRRFRKAA